MSPISRGGALASQVEVVAGCGDADSLLEAHPMMPPIKSGRPASLAISQIATFGVVRERGGRAPPR